MFNACVSSATWVVILLLGGLARDTGERTVPAVPVADAESGAPARSVTPRMRVAAAGSTSPAMQSRDEGLFLSQCPLGVQDPLVLWAVQCGGMECTGCGLCLQGQWVCLTGAPCDTPQTCRCDRAGDWKEITVIRPNAGCIKYCEQWGGLRTFDCDCSKANCSSGVCDP